MMTKVIKWFAAFLEDQGGNPSSKRMIGYFSCYLLLIIVKASLDGKNIDQNILLAVVGIILFSIGAITSEFFKEKLK